MDFIISVFVIMLICLFIGILGDISKEDGSPED